jgi:hypothetical protein
MFLRFGGDFGLLSPLLSLTFIALGLRMLFLDLDLADVEPIEEERS